MGAIELPEIESKLFPTQEIGSIAKPAWRVKGISKDGRINEREVREAARWGRILSIPDYEKLIRILARLARFSQPSSEGDKLEIRNWSVRYVLGLFERVGLDRVYSGEQWRVEMYEHLVRNIDGFKLLGSVQSFDNKYFTKGAIVSPPKFLRPIHLDEFEFVRKHTNKDVKVPITGPYTVVDWSFNEFYENEFRKRNGTNSTVDLKKTYFEARRAFILALVREVLRKELASLIQNGAAWIQIDEPAVTTRPDPEEMELFVEAINELTNGFGSCAFSLHNCYSDYKLLAHYSPQLKDIKQLALEFANRDGVNLGQSLRERRGYADLAHFEDEGYIGGFGLGVTHVHDFSGRSGNGAKLDGRDILETPKLVRDRILAAAKLLKDPARISVNPDCGLRTRTWDVAYHKLVVMKEGVELAREQIK